VIIPVHNKAGFTRKCLDAVIGVVAGGERQIVVVDDGSTDGTAKLLQSYGDAITIVDIGTSVGFAEAANAGAAAAAATEFLVFLNNDTIPRTGWLDRLEEYAAAHPAAAVVGARLVYANRTIQHAGVAICTDGTPRHLYAGFPEDHPAVNRARRFQAVTAACMLVRRARFESAGGFDGAYRNGYEDIDFCLRVGRDGHEVHYNPESVVVHYESGSRGQDSAENHHLFKARWATSLKPDEIDYYLADGLLRIQHSGPALSSIAISPLLASVSRDPSELTDLLRARTRQVRELLRETARLTERAVAAEPAIRIASRAGVEPAGDRHADGDGTGWSAVDRDDDLLDEIYASQQRALEPSPQFGYHQLARRVRDVICASVPPGGTVAVISKGDDSLIENLQGRTGLHFPDSGEGDEEYAGHHPADSTEAIRAVDRAKRRGAKYLAIPQTAMWWLDHYPEFGRWLTETGSVVADVADVCRVYAIRPKPMFESSVLKTRVNAEIHPDDEMYATSPAHYFVWGDVSVQLIEQALALAGVHEEPRSILDLPCGHGRVLRALRARWPDADLGACDLLRDGVEFCARTFGATPIYAEEGGTRIELPMAYDVIWCGSLLTHLGAHRWPWFLKLFEEHLSDRGVLIFTTHGVKIVETLRDGRSFWVPDQARMVDEFNRTGFAYQDYIGQHGYGISLSSAGWVARTVARETGLAVVAHLHHGWHNNQDAVVCVRGPLEP